MDVLYLSYIQWVWGCIEENPNIQKQDNFSMKKGRNGNRCHRKGCAVALGTDSPPVTFPRSNRWGWSRGEKRMWTRRSHLPPREIFPRTVRVHISRLRFSTVCPTHTHRSLMDLRLCASPVLDWDASKDDWPQDCSSWDPGGYGSQGTQKPRSRLIGHSGPQVPDLQTQSIFPAEWPSGAGAYMLPTWQITWRVRWLSPSPAVLPSRPRSSCSQSLLPSAVPSSLTSLHRRPEVDEGGGAQCHIIVTSTDLGQESCPPREHRVLGEPCPSWHHRSTVVITQQGVVSITDRWVLGAWILDNTVPYSPLPWAGQLGQRVWTLMRVETIRGCCITVGFNSVPETLNFSIAHSPAGSAGPQTTPKWLDSEWKDPGCSHYK